MNIWMIECFLFDCCNQFVPSLTYPKTDHFASQAIRLEFGFSAKKLVADNIAYALALCPKFTSNSGDGQRHFDLM